MVKKKREMLSKNDLNFKNIKENPILFLKKFWNYLWYDDSLLSYILNFLFAFIFIKYIFFPGIGAVLDTQFPIVAIVSGSMEHKVVSNSICGKLVDNGPKNLNINQFWNHCSKYYVENYNFTLDQFENFPFNGGLNIGDVMILKGKDAKDIIIGDVLVFIPENREWYLSHGPVIHRVVKKWEENDKYYFQTKGDHNSESFQGFEKNISEDDVLGVGVVRIPYLGYAKILLNDIFLLFTR